MTCEAYQDLLEALALGDDSLSEAERFGAEAHLAECVSCRDEFQALRRLTACLRRVEAVADELPQDVVERSRRQILLAVKEDSPRRKWHGVFWPSDSVQRIRWACAVGLAAAALILLTIVCLYRPDGSVPEQVVVPQPEKAQPTRIIAFSLDQKPVSQDVRPVVSAPESQALTKEDLIRLGPAKALERSREDFEWARAVPGGRDFRLIIEFCEALAKRWPGSEEALSALELISRCYTQLAEPDLARTAFLAYADAAGEQAYAEALENGSREAQAENARYETTSPMICKEARALYNERDLVEAVEYYNVLLQRYPEQRAAGYALWRLGFCYEAAGDLDQAIACYEQVKGNLGPDAMRRAARLQLNRSDKDMKSRFEDSIAVHRRLSEKFPEHACRSLQEIASLELMQGDFTEALLIAARVKNEFAENRSAKEWAEKFSAQVAEQMLKQREPSPN